MPEWQGAGVGLRFLNAFYERWRRGRNPYGRPMPTLFNTSHPGLAAALRRHPDWCQESCRLHGQSKANSRASITLSARRRGAQKPASAGYGGHFRAAQGFRYMGEPGP